MTYSAEKGHLYCQHCGSVEEIARDYNVRERDFAEMANVPRWSNTNATAYRCSNCGAQTIVSATTIATSCPFCGSAVVVDASVLDSVQPDTVIPFETTVDQARQAIMHWRKRRVYAPRKFRKNINVDSVKGVFTPVWTFDCNTTTHYSGTVGDRRTRTVTVNGKKVTQTYIHWYYVSGTIDQLFDDIFVNGDKNIPQKQIDKLSPFPQDKYVVYNDKYLAGYVANNYTVPPQQAFATAQAVIQSVIERAIMSKHNADVKGTLSLDTQYLSKSFKYLMLPLYLTPTKHGKKLFHNYVSGLTNTNVKKIKVSGKAPVSWWKVLLTVVAGAFAALVLAYMLTTG